MKSFFLSIVFSICSQFLFAQLTTTPVCPPFVVDIMGGNVSKMYPKSTTGEIQKAFPCFTDAVEKGTDSACAGVFFKDQGLLFFTDRNYIEVNENYKGKMTPALMGTNRTALFSLLGYPKLKDPNWEAFQTEYGTLVLYFDKAGKINKLQISSKSTETLKLCK